MKLPEHLALSYLLAQFGVQQQYGPAGTALMIAAGILPDLDGLTALGGWGCHRRYHRVLGHGLPVTLGGPLLLAWAGAGLLPGAALLPLWAWLQLSVLAHLAFDVLFYRWPVQLAWPVSARGLGLGLIGWNDLVPTLLLYGGVAAAAARPEAARTVAAVSLGVLSVYIGLRARRPGAGWRWERWLTGGWARRSPRFWRWLTGDFIPCPVAAVPASAAGNDRE
jgi:membrane-bound metal-dependent hydrolase YbcI (DUF457 family)